MCAGASVGYHTAEGAVVTMTSDIYSVMNSVRQFAAKAAMAAGTDNEDRHICPWRNIFDNLHAVRIGRLQIQKDGIGNVGRSL